MLRLNPRRRLVLSAILIAIAILLFSCAGTLYGGLGVDVPRSEMLDNLLTQPDGSLCNEPCMFGVYVGKTKFADISTILRSHPYIISHFRTSDFAKLYSEGQRLQATTSEFGIDFLEQNSVVGNGNIGGNYRPYRWLEIVPSVEMPTLVQIIRTLGIPQYVRFTRLPRHGQFDKEFFYSVHLTYPQKGLNISFAYLPDASLKPDDRPLSIYMVTSANVSNWGSSWQGFISIQDYIRNTFGTIVEIVD